MKPVAFSVAFLILLAGCSSIRDVPRSEIKTGTTFENVRAATVDGFEYRFVRADVLPDTLVGFYSVTLERSNERNEIWFEDVLRRHKIPLKLVRNDPVKTAFYGMSMLAAGYVLVTFVEEEAGDPGSSGSGGKAGSPIQW